MSEKYEFTETAKEKLESAKDRFSLSEFERIIEISKENAYEKELGEGKLIQREGIVDAICQVDEHIQKK